MLDAVPEMVPDGYEGYWSCYTKRNGYSGTACFTRLRPQSVRYEMLTSDEIEAEPLREDFDC